MKAIVTCLICLVLAFALGPVSAVQLPLSLESLKSGDKVYYGVTVKKQTPTSLLITHQSGVAQVYLSTLEPEMQAFFGYKPDVAQRYEENKNRLMERAESKTRKAQEDWLAYRGKNAGDVGAQQIAEAVARYGTEPEIRPEVDFSELAETFPAKEGAAPKVKAQGRRPSCAIFAVSAALELQYARAAKSFTRFSETYLIWATQHVTGRRVDPKLLASANRPTEEEAAGADADAGFAIVSVLEALETHGAVTESEMSYQVVGKLDEIPEPSEELKKKGAEAFKVTFQSVPGLGETLVSNVIHCLNAEVPVVIGLKWPHFKGIEHGMISKQTPREEYRHAVTLFGYRSESGKREDTRYYFKNSWGQYWGRRGYGWITHDYLTKNLETAHILEIHLPQGTSGQ